MNPTRKRDLTNSDRDCKTYQPFVYDFLRDFLG